jgi:hypothetical protein
LVLSVLSSRPFVVGLSASNSFFRDAIHYFAAVS